MSGGGDSNPIAKIKSNNFPVKTASLITPNFGVSIVIHVYSNRLFILVSEVDSGSTGTLVEFRKEFAPDVPSSNFEEEDANCGGDASTSASNAQDVVYDIKILFGVEKPEILLAARVLGSKIHQSNTTELPIIFGFGLKRFDKQLLEEVTQAVVEKLSLL